MSRAYTLNLIFARTIKTPNTLAALEEDYSAAPCFEKFEASQRCPNDVSTSAQTYPDTMYHIDRSFLDCDPFGVIPINDGTPPFICALFGNDAQATAGVTNDISACCSPYYPAQHTTGNGCDHHWCGVPAYEAKGTDTSTWQVVPYPTEGTVRSTVTSTTTQTYDAIVAYPKVSSCLSSVALWNAYAFACRVGGELGEVSMTGPDPMSTTPTATATPWSTTSGSAIATATGADRSAAPTKSSFVWLLLGTFLLSVWN